MTHNDHDFRTEGPGDDPRDARVPTDAIDVSKRGKLSSRGQVVLLSGVLVVTLFFSLAGVPGEPEQIVSDGSDALRKGWMEERLLEYYHGPARAEGEVIVTDGGAMGVEELRSIRGTWLEEALRVKDAGAQAQTTASDELR